MAILTREYWRKLEDFGRLVWSYRRRNHHRQSRGELSAACGISAATLGLIERGKVPPSQEVFNYLAEILQWSSSDRKKFYADLPALRAKRGAPKGTRDEIVEKWLAGRRVFRDIIDRWRAEHEWTKSQLAQKSGVSRIVMSQIYNLTYPVPRNGVCRRIASCCGKKPTRLLLLRMISTADPALRRDVVKMFFPLEHSMRKEMIREEVHGVVPLDLGVDRCKQTVHEKK